MRKLLTFLLIIALCSTSFGADIEDSSLYREYPQHSELFKTYWNRFVRAKVARGDSGEQIAALAMVADAESDLVEAGLSFEQLLVLNAQAESIYQKQHLKILEDSIEKLERDRTVMLLEKIDIESLEGILKEGPGIFKHHPLLAEEFDFYSANLVISGDEIAFRLGTGLLLLVAAQKDGYDFSTPPGRVSLDATLKILSRWIAESKSETAAADIAMPKSLRKTIIQRWRESRAHDGKDVRLHLVSAIAKLSGGFGLVVVGVTTVYTMAWKELGLDTSPLVILGSSVGVMTFLLTATMVSVFRAASLKLPRTQGLKILKRCRPLEIL